MDSLTHIVLGAAVGTAVLGRKVGPRAALWGAVCGTLPDLDVLLPYGDPVRDFTFHRAHSHALFWLSIASPFIAWIIFRLQRNAGATFRDWWLLAWLALVTHPLLDAFTVYGTQLLLPFSDYPVGVGSVFIIDPLFTVPIAVGAALALALRNRNPDRAQHWNAAGLALGAAYLGWSVAAQSHVEGVVNRTLAATPLVDSRVLVTPAPFNTLLWRVVVMDDGGYHEGYYSLLDDRPIVRLEHHASAARLLEPLRQDWTVQRLAWFSKGFYSVNEAPAGLQVARWLSQFAGPAARLRRYGVGRRSFAWPRRCTGGHDRPAHGPDAVVRIRLRRCGARHRRRQCSACTPGTDATPARRRAGVALATHLAWGRRTVAVSSRPS